MRGNQFKITRNRRIVFPSWVLSRGRLCSSKVVDRRWSSKWRTPSVFSCPRQPSSRSPSPGMNRILGLAIQKLKKSKNRELYSFTNAQRSNILFEFIYALQIQFNCPSDTYFYDSWNRHGKHCK